MRIIARKFLQGTADTPITGGSHSAKGAGESVLVLLRETGSPVSG